MNTENIKKLKGFKFWSQKVLPLVYDESLSYYEVLCKISAHLNDIIEAQNVLSETVVQELTEFDEILKQMLAKIDTRLAQIPTEVKELFDNYVGSEEFIAIVTGILSELVDEYLAKKNDVFSISVEHYGAVGDGITDDTSAFYRAMNESPIGALIIGDSNKTYLLSGVSFKRKFNGNNCNIKFNDVEAPVQIHTLNDISNVSFVGVSKESQFTAQGVTIENCNFIRVKLTLITADCYVNNCDFTENEIAIEITNRITAYINNCIAMQCKHFVYIHRYNEDVVGRYAIINNCSVHIAGVTSSTNPYYFVTTNAPVDIHNCLFGGLNDYSCFLNVYGDDYATLLYPFKITNNHAARCQISNLPIPNLKVYGYGNTGVLPYLNRTPIAVASANNSVIGVGNVYRNIDRLELYISGMITPTDLQGSLIVGAYNTGDFGNGVIVFPCCWHEGVLSNTANAGFLEFNGGYVYLRGVPTGLIESIYFYCSAVVPY